MSFSKCDLIFRILLLGDPNVGKTSIFLRFFDDNFKETYNTYSMDYRMKIVEIGEKIINLQIWDSPGHDRLRSIVQNYYKGADGIIIVYDITNLNSFKNVKYWINRVIENISPNKIIVLVGNKCDSPERVVSEEEGRKLAEEYNINFFEISAKTDINIEEIFDLISNEILKVGGGKIMNDRKKVILKKKKSGCQIY